MMSKQDTATPETSRNSLRSPERQALAQAIAARDAADQRESTLTRAAERAKADRFLATRDVEEAERSLNRAREAAREVLVDTYAFMGGDEGNDSRAAPGDVIEAGRTLAAAQRRASDLAMVEQELAARTGPAPGRSLPAIEVDKRVRAVVRSAPITRRLVEDFRTAERTFQQYQATLIFLAGLNCIPDDLVGSAPKAHHTRYAEPNPVWKAAIESLKRDPDAELPS
jgi:hypothetical protein